MTAWLFPGQGSQRRGMGADLLSAFPELCATADAILGYPVAELCLEDPEGRLGQTRYAQPALFFVSALAWLARPDRDHGPRFLAGHSLGEYNALLAGGCFDFATGLRLVRRRGELMSEAATGGMLAVLGLDADELRALLERAGADDVDLANHNARTQLVLSGPRESLARAARSIEQESPRARLVPLNVSAAFHSRLMGGAAAAFAAFLRDVPFRDPSIPVVANVTARPYEPGSVADLLAEQVRRPVRWSDSMRYLLDQGVRDVEEPGPGRVLTDLWRDAIRDPMPPAEAPGPTAATTATLAATPADSPAEALGDPELRRDYGIRYAYFAGSMFKGIASADLVVRMGRAGLMGFFGAGGLGLPEIEAAIATIRRGLGSDGCYGMNLLAAIDDMGLEAATVDLYLRQDVRHVEAAAYTQVTGPLVRFRFTGAHLDGAGQPVAVRHVVAKVSRPEVADAFMRPPPEALLARLVEQGALTPDEATAARHLPVSHDVCVEADSGGHTDGGVAYALMPAMTRLRDEAMTRHGYRKRIRIGAAGGLGSPEAVAAAFVLGADFVVTGSINQCSPEAATSAAVKDMLADLDVQDTTYAPAGDMFELGARVQVVRKGTLFPARGNKLYQLYRQCASLDDIDAQTRQTIERTYFQRSFEDVWRETSQHLARQRPDDLDQAERNPRQRLALTFRWYFVHSTRVAIAGVPEEKVNYQIHSGPAIGAFNRFVRGGDLEDWRSRHVDVVAERLMSGAAELLRRRLDALTTSGCTPHGEVV